MNVKEFEGVSKLPGNKRYEYFIKKVADNEELWGLYNDGWAMVADDDGNEMIPFWPRKEFAEACPAIFYTKGDKGVVVKPEKLTEDLNEELENY